MTILKKTVLKFCCLIFLTSTPKAYAFDLSSCAVIVSSLTIVGSIAAWQIANDKKFEKLYADRAARKSWLDGVVKDRGTSIAQDALATELGKLGYPDSISKRLVSENFKLATDLYVESTSGGYVYVAIPANTTKSPDFNRITYASTERESLLEKLSRLGVDSEMLTLFLPRDMGYRDAHAWSDAGDVLSAEEYRFLSSAVYLQDESPETLKLFEITD